MSLADQLKQERAARVAAEQALTRAQEELTIAREVLDAQAALLGGKISETQAAVLQMQGENLRVKTELGKTTEEYQHVKDMLWAALTAIQDGFAIFDSQNRLELANPAFLAPFDHLGGLQGGISYTQILDIMLEQGLIDLEGQDQTTWRAQILAYLDNPDGKAVTLRFADGHYVKVQNRRLPDGGLVSLISDVTELIRIWHAIEQLPDGFVMYDSEDRLVMCNEPYLQIYEASRTAITPGARFEDILRYGLDRGQYMDGIGREEAWLQERLEAHAIADTELEQKLPDGRWVRVYERGTMDGGRVGLRIDITQNKATQDRLRDATQKAEAASRAKSAFLANMSHEIRTPMNGVVGMAELLQETPLNEEQRLYLDTIRNSGEALLVIINDVLDYSKIEADRIELLPEPFDLESAVHEVVMLLQPAAREKSVEMLVDYDMFLPTCFVGDVGRFRQVLTNIIGNAVKFTLKGHVLVRVVGEAGEDGKAAIHLTVEDTGIGIPPDQLDKVFGTFNQVEDERNRKFEGTGLGLAISQRLVELMGGQIWVDSTLGKGSSFGLRLELSIAAAKEQPQPLVPKSLNHLTAIGPPDPNRSILCKQLNYLGLGVAYFETSDGLFDKTWHSGDAVLIHGDIDGYKDEDMLRALRASGCTVPIILMSAAPAAVASDVAEEAFAILQRPAPRKVLYATLNRLDQPNRPEGAIKPSPAQVMQPRGDQIDVLLAEDNKTNQLVFRKMVQDLNLNLRFAANGYEAIAAFEDRRPDMIFMDISMPEMDGKEATQHIRRLEGHAPPVPIIAVTAHAMEGDAEKIMAAGLDDYLTKPLRKAALIEMIHRYTPARIQAAG